MKQCSTALENVNQNSTKIPHLTRCQWFTLVILAAWEAEIGRFKASLGI
jgi:hypothetical protein